MSHSSSLEDLTASALDAERQKRWSQAAVGYAALRDAFPEHEVGWLGGARAALEHGRAEEADQLLSEALARWPASYTFASAHAAAAAQRGLLASAAERWTAVVASFPNNPGAWAGLCSALNRDRQHAEADKRATEAIERFPAHLPLHIEQVRAAEGARRWDEAFRRWQAFDARFPDRSEARVGLALALREQRKLDEAETVVKEALRVFPRDRPLLEAAALVAQVRRAWPDAIARWDTLLTYYPDSLPAHRGRVLAFRESGRLDEAQAASEAALALHPTSVPLLSEQARLAGTRSDWAQAQRSWETVAALTPAAAQPIAEIGWALMRQNRYDEAETFLESRLAQFEAQPDVAICHAQVAARLRRWDEAASRWHALEARFPNDPGVLGGLAEALWALKQSEALEAVLDRLLALQPDSPTGAILYGRLEMRRNQAALAVTRMTAAAARWPTNTSITATLNDARMQALVESSDEPQAPSERRTSAPAAATTSAEAELFSQFESLGNGCEFGLLQRRFGVEPLGLLRWGAITPDGLIDMLEHRFEHVGDIETTEVEPDGDSYILRDSRYRMGMQTFIATSQEPADTLLPKLCARMRYLARELVDSLEEADRILVYKAANGIRDLEIDRLWAAISAYGDNVLLVTRLADRDHEPGSLEVISDGLMIGFISHFSNTAIDAESWTSVCRAAVEARAQTLSRRQVMASRDAWI